MEGGGEDELFMLWLFVFLRKEGGKNRCDIETQHQTKRKTNNI